MTDSSAPGATRSWLPSGAPMSRPWMPCRHWRWRVLLVGLLLPLAACNRSTEPPTPAASLAGPASGASAGAGPVAAAASAPPVSVTTVPARVRDLPVVLETTGTIVPVSSVDVRPQVSSVITQVHVREGQFVRAGQLLFTLDARADEANVARLAAQLARDQATLADAQRQLARSRDLVAQNFVSQGAVDTNQTLVDSATAAVAADRAAVDAARVTLAYSRLTAPGPGRVGAINVFVGTAVQANQTTLLTITQLDPIDVAFTVPQRHLGDLLAALQSGGAAVTAALPDGGGTQTGKLQFVDNSVDAASGTVRAKARFENKASKLWPGAFVRAALTVRTLEKSVVVPQACIIEGTRGSIVYVAEGGRAALRPVKVLAVQGEDAAVSGLRPGDRVVLDGRQNLRPGALVIERAREGGGGARGGASGTGRGAPEAGARGASEAGTRGSGAPGAPTGAALPNGTRATAP